MKKKISRGCAVLLACAMLAGLLMTTAFARASDYLAIYSVWATAKSDGVVRIHADVEAVRTSDEVGVSYITVQESDDGGKTWTTLKKYTKEDLNMYEENTDYYYGTFDFEDTVIGRDYRALVGVYAERNGGGDLRSVYTNEVTAKSDGWYTIWSGLAPLVTRRWSGRTVLVLSVLLLWQTGAGRRTG